MTIDYHEKFVIKAKEKYKRIGNIKCAALNNEIIYFNQKGFRHLLYKRNDRRRNYQQNRRLKLLIYAPLIIKSASKIKEFRKIQSGNDTIYFWALEKVIGKKLITLIIRQINDGSKHFFSIMDK